MKNNFVILLLLIQNITFITCFEQTNLNNLHSRIKLIKKRQASSNLCSRVTCYNGGTCSQSNNLLMCRCATNYYGMYCQFSKSAVTTRNPMIPPTRPSFLPNSPLCAMVSCLNGGSCYSNDQANFQCLCVNGFSGQFCQMPPANQFQPNTASPTQAPPSFDICLLKNCLNAGQCIRLSQTTGICQCQNGYSGDSCEIAPFDICAIKNCLNGGQCVRTSQTTALCRCQSGYSGDFCEIVPPIDICVAYNCKNNAQCLKLGQYYAICVCQPGFTGQFCEMPIPPTTTSTQSTTTQNPFCANRNSLYRYTPGLTNYWPFCGNTYDVVGGAHLFNQNNFNFVRDRFTVFSGAASLNRGYLQAPPGVYFNHTDFTVMAWVKVRTYGNWSRILDFTNLDSNKSTVYMAYSAGSTGRPQVGFENETGAYHYSVNLNKTLTIGQWEHITMTVLNSWLYLYINGDMIDRRMSDRPSALLRKNCYIGRTARDITETHADAEIDDIKIFNRGLTESEILFEKENNMY